MHLPANVLMSCIGAESDSEESGGEEAKRTMENGSEELSKRQFKQPEDEIGTANAVTLSRHNERESSRRSSPAGNHNNFFLKGVSVLHFALPFHSHVALCEGQRKEAVNQRRAAERT